LGVEAKPVPEPPAPDEEEPVPKYELPELPYDYSALEPHLSGQIVELHHDKHHKAYVDGANTTLDKLAEAREAGNFPTINQLEKNLAFHVSGHVLHSLFWTNMSPDGGGEPDGELAAAVKEGFGSFDSMRAQLTQAAMGIQGSGWGALSWEPTGGLLVVEQIYDHQGNVGQGSMPLLVLDMWEHAFYLQYKNVKKDWVDAFWNLVNWSDVASRFGRVKSLELV
jgi:Fe-Mn family superoxide dismutase